MTYPHSEVRDSRRPAIIVASLTGVIQVLRILWFLRLPVGRLVQHVPDDAFYYLVLARNFALRHRWTFDGVAPASGFHLCWGYLLVLIFKLDPFIGIKPMFALCAGIEAAAMALAAGLTVAALSRLIAPRAAWPVAVIFLSAISLMQSTLMMEGPLVLLAGALLLYQLSRASDSGGSVALGVLVGCFGTLARSDFGLLPFWIFVGLVASRPQDAERRTLVGVAAAQLAGAICGVAILFAHTYWLSGHFTQSSAQIKLLWAAVQHTGIKLVLVFQQDLVSPLYNAVAPFETNFWSHHFVAVLGYRVRNLLYLLLLIGAVLFSWRHRRERSGALVAASLGILACYSIFYRFDGAIQVWYIVSFELPVCVLAVATWNNMRERTRFRLYPLAIVLCIAGVVFSFRAQDPWQEVMYRAGLLLHDHPELKPAGSWNSGIINYFAGGGVTNLDGLVNDDAVAYIKAGRFADYMAQRQIGHLVESPDILTGTAAARSGIADGRLVSCITARQALFPDDPFDVFDQTHLTLMTVDDACLLRGNPVQQLGVLKNP